MSTSKIVLYAKNKKKNGLIPIYLRVLIDRKKREYPLNIDTLEEHWDFTKNIFKKAAPSSQQKNTLILKAISKADNIFLDCQIKGIKISHQYFEKVFYDEAKTDVDERLEVIGKELVESYKGKYSDESIDHFIAALSKIGKFRQNIMLSEMDYKFFTEYEQYMRVVLKNNSNTVRRSIAYFRNLLDGAVKLGYLSKNPLSDYKVKGEESKAREFLSIEEVNNLENLLNNKLNPNLKNTLIAFLFACYTSLRYSDLKLLTKNNIKNDEIIIKQQKTKGYVSVPLSEQAKEVLKHSESNSESYLFKTYSNQKMNDYLKILAMMAGIDKNLSFHVARHTFATISLNLGIRIEVVSSLLGHRSLKTTNIYAKLLDKTKHDEMKKWELVKRTK